MSHSNFTFLRSHQIHNVECFYKILQNLKKKQHKIMLNIFCQSLIIWEPGIETRAQEKPGPQERTGDPRGAEQFPHLGNYTLTPGLTEQMHHAWAAEKTSVININLSKNRPSAKVMKYFMCDKDSRSKEVKSCGYSSGKLSNTERHPSATVASSSLAKSRAVLLAI